MTPDGRYCFYDWLTYEEINECDFTSTTVMVMTYVQFEAAFAAFIDVDTFLDLLGSGSAMFKLRSICSRAANSVPRSAICSASMRTSCTTTLPRYTRHDILLPLQMADGYFFYIDASVQTSTIGITTTEQRHAAQLLQCAAQIRSMGAYARRIRWLDLASSVYDERIREAHTSVEWHKPVLGSY